MATFTVNTAADTNNGNIALTTGSLRDGITYANANPGTTIVFSISNATITPGSALPIVSNATVIDGGTSNVTVTGTYGGLSDYNSLTLQGATTYTASTALTAGTTLTVNGTTTIGNVNANSGSTLKVGSGGVLTRSIGTVVNTNSGMLTVVNQGTISNTSDGANTFNGAATLNVVNAGTISTLGDYALTSSGTGAVVTNAAGGTLEALKNDGNANGVYLGSNATINNYGTIQGSGYSLDAYGANATVNLFAGSTTGKVGLLGGTSTLSLYTGTGTSAAGATDASTGITLQALGTNAAASVGAIAFGGSGNTLVLTGSGDATNANGVVGSLALSTVTGANTITKTGTGTFQLSGSAAGTGNSLINAGTGATAGVLLFSGTSGLTSTINVDGAKIEAFTAGAFGTGTINAIDPTIEYSANGTFANAIVLDSASTGDPTKLEADTGVTATLTGGITQSSSNGLAAQPLVVDGGGTIVLAAPSSYTGATTVAGGGTLQGGATNAFASGSAFTVNSTLDLGGFSETIGSLTGAGVVTNSGSAAASLTTGGLNASPTFTGTIQNGTGVTSLTKVGTGTLTLTGANTYTGGTTFAGGELDAGSVGALGSTGTLSFTGGTLQYSAANQTDYSSRFSTAAGQATSIDTNGQAVTFASGLTSSGGTLTKSGTGTLTLAGTDTFTGGTNINAGTLALSSISALAATDAVTLANVAGATLAVNASNTIGSLNGGGTTGGAVTIASGDTLTIGGANTSTTYAGTVSGAGVLTKSGTGTLTLSGASTNAADYASAGTLTLAASATLTTAGGAIPSASVDAAAGVGVGATLVNAGVITATGGGEDGVDVHAGTFVNSGTLQGATYQGVYVTGGGTVTNTGSISGGNGVLSIDAGALTVTGGGSITGTVGDGINATLVGANNIVLGTTGAALGAVTGAAKGIEATTSGAGTIGLVTGANVTGLNGAGISTATSGSGATSITAGGGTIKGTTIGLGVTTSGSGTVSVTTLAGETVQSGSGSAIVATATSASSGAVTVTNAATLSHASGTGSDGIDAETSGTGGIVVTNSGAIGATGGTFATGILAGATTAASNVTVSNNAGGTIGAAGNAVTGTGIHAYASGTGNASVNVINGAAITATAFGIQASDAGNGNVNVYGGGAINAGTTGISAVETGGGSANVGVNYSTLGAITAAADGIDVSTGLGGSVTVYAGAVTSTAGSGIVASVSGGTGAIAVTIGGNVSGAQDGLSVASGSLGNTIANAFNVAGAIGLEVNGGTTTLTNTGTITGTTNAIKIDAGTLAIGNSAGTITGAIADAGTLAFTNTTAIALASAITGAGSVTQTGTGTTTLSGANTYTGATTVSAGTLKAGSTSAFAGGSAFTVSNATLDLGGFSQTIGSLSGAFSTVTNSGTAAVTLTTGGTGGSSFSGTIQDGANGTVALTKVGTGNFTLNAASTYSGGTTISAGQLSATNVVAFGTGAVTDNAALQFSTPTGTIANAISGSGTLSVQQTAGTTATFSGALTGGLALNVSNGGTVVLTNTGDTRTGATTVGASTTLQGTTATLTGGAITDNGTLAFHQTGAGMFASAISGAGAVTVAGGGTVTLSGALTQTGGFTVSDASNVTLAATGSYNAAPSIATNGGAFTDLGSVTATSAAAVTASAGGTITIGSATNATASITGSTYGITDGNYQATGALTVNNYGTITNTTNALDTQTVAKMGTGGLTLTNYGTGVIDEIGSGSQSFAIGSSTGDSALNVTNLSGGTIIGSNLAIYGRHAGDTIVNAGIIASGSYNAGTKAITLGGTNAIALLNGGSVTNQAGGLIESATRAITDNSTTLALNLSNSGTIKSGSMDGVTSQTTATVLNTGTIVTSGLSGVIAYGVLTVTNAFGGTLTGGSNTTYGYGVVINGATGIANNYGTINGGAGGIGTTDNAAATVSLFAGSTTGSVSLGTAASTVSLYTGTGTANTTAVTSVDPISGATVTVRAAGTFAAASVGTIALGSNNATTLNLMGAGDGSAANGAIGTLALGGVTGTGTITKTGTGTFLLTGGAVGTGGSAINAGTGSAAGLLQFSGATSLATTINVNGAKIQALTAGAFGTGTINAIDPTIEYSATGTYANPIVLTSSSTGDPTKLEADVGVTATLSGTITQGSGAGVLANQSVVFDGGGTVVLTNTGNSWTGTTTVSNGSTLRIDAASELGTGGIVLGNGALQFADTGAIAISSAITGAGSVTQTGIGTTTLTGAETYTGGTTVSAGTLQLGDGTTTGTIVGDVVDNATLAFDPGTAGDTFAGIVSGTGAVSKIGAGTEMLSGSNTFTGGLNAAAGRVVEQNTGNALGAGSVNIATGAIVELLNESTSTIVYQEGNTFTGTGTLQKTGAGLSAFGGNNGVTTVSLSTGGVLDVEAGTLDGSSSGQASYTGNQGGLNIASGAIFDGVEGTIIVDQLTGSGTLEGGYNGAGSTTIGVAGGSGTFSGLITDATSGALSLIKAGAGTETLTGTGTYTGGTTISAGTLQLGDGTTTGTIVGDVVDNGTLTLDPGAAGDTFDGNVSGTGAVSKTGTGTETLTGTLTNATINAGTGSPAGTLVFSGTIGDTATINVDGAKIQALSSGAFGTGTINAIDPMIEYSATGTYANPIVLDTASASDPTKLEADAGVIATLAGAITSSTANGGIMDQPVVFDGGGTVVLTNTGNLWSGTTTVSNGSTLSIDAASELGTGGLALGDATTAGTLILTNAAGTSFATGQAVTVGAGGGTVSVANGGAGDDTLSGAISGTGVLTTTGMLTLSGASTNAADYASAGTLTLAAGATLTTAGGVIPGASVAAAGVAAGATLVNAGTINANGNEDGVDVVGGTFVNSGLLTGAAYQGVYVTGGGTVTNISTGSISGGNGVLSIDAGALTVTGGGSIAGTLGEGIDATRVGANNIVLGTTAPGAALGAVTGAADGIVATTSLAGNIGIVTAGTVSGSNGDGIQASANGNGTVSVTANGDVTGTSDGISVAGTTANDTVTVGSGATVSGAIGLEIAGDTTTLANSGTITTTANGGNAIQIDSGTLVIGDAAGTITGAIADAGALQFTNTGAIAISSAITGAGSVTQTGTGTTTLTGANTYMGGTTISAGTLQLGDGTTTGTIVGDVVDNGTLAFDPGAAGDTFAGIVSGTGAVSKIGAGTETLSGANTYTGGTVLAAGTLDLASATASGGTTAAPGTVAFTTAAATLQLDAAALASGGSYAGAVSGFQLGDTLDLRGLGYASDETATLSGSTLTVGDATASDTLTGFGLASGQPAYFVASADGQGGTDVTLQMQPAMPTPATVSPSSASYGAPLTITGTGNAAGDTITVYGAEANTPNLTIKLGTTTVASDGSLGFTDTAPAGEVPDGTFVITTTETTAGGTTQSMMSTPTTVVVGASAPTGLMQVGSPSNGGMLEIRGTGDSVGDVVTVYAATNGGAATAIGTKTVSQGGTFDFTASGAFADGTYAITATNTSADGTQVSAMSAPLVATVSASAPTGLAQKGTAANGGTIEITGTTTDAVGDTIKLYANGGTTVVGTGTVMTGGSFDIVTTMPFADGSVSLKAIDTSVDGTQVSIASAPLVATVGAVAPTGLAQKGTAANGGTIEITGTTTDAVGDTIKLYANGGTTVVGTGTVMTGGSFDIVTTMPFADGSVSLKAIDTSVDGTQVSVASAPLVATVGAVAPTGLAQKGTAANGGTIEITGTTTDAVGDTIKLYANGGTTVVGTGTVMTGGSFDIVTTMPFADGSVSLKAIDTSVDGTQVSIASAPLVATVGAVAPTGLAQKGTAANGGTIEITGTTTDAVGDTIKLYANGGTTVIGTGTVRTGGSFDIVTTMPFADGSVSLKAIDTSVDGTQVSIASAPLVATVGAVAPTGLAQKGTAANGGTIEITGTTTDAVGDTIKLYANGGTTVIGTGTVRTGGSFDITTTMTFQTGSDNIMATDTSFDGTQVSVMSAPVVATVISPVTISGSGSTISIVDPTISGTTDVSGAGSTITLTSGQTVLGSTIVASNGTWSDRIILPTDGAYTIVASETVNGVTSKASELLTLNSLPNQPLFGTITHDVTSPGGSIYALYETILGRAPDATGYENWVTAQGNGTPLSTIAQGFLSSGEYAADYGSSTQSNDAFINQLYQDGLHRPADAGGLKTWENALATGTSRAQVAIDIATSQESQQDLAATFQTGVFVPDATDAGLARLYYGVLGRAPDAIGLQNWEGAVHSGLSLTQAAQSFLGSSEYQGTAMGQSNLNYIQGLYQTALGRTGEPGAVQNYETALDTGTATRATVANAFLGSSEFQKDEAGQTNSAYVNTVYQAALGRQADANGLQTWDALMAGGTSRVTVAQDIVGSAEFASTVTNPSQASFVNALYEGALGRPADAGGLQANETAIAGGASLASIVLGVTQSAEAVGHLAPAVETGFHIA